MNRNYSRELDAILGTPENKGKKLFLHSCCAPCSSYVLEYLRNFFRITVFYYNPNITQEAEYRHRVEEQKRLIQIFNDKAIREPEEAYPIRLLETARRAKEAGADYFTTTLTISPLKNASKINEIGDRIGGMADIAFLPSDFKKKNGYKRSVELSKEYDLYRQDYCGCVFSRR